MRQGYPIGNPDVERGRRDHMRGRHRAILAGFLAIGACTGGQPDSTTTVPTFALDAQVMAVIDSLADAAGGATEAWPSVASEAGFEIFHFGGPWYWPAGTNPFEDTNLYEWSGEAGEPPWPLATVAALVGTSFVDTYQDPDVRFGVNEGVSGPEAAPSYIPTLLEPFPFVAVHDPGDDPLAGSLDWTTWYVFFDWTQDGWRAIGMSVDSYAP